MDSVEDYFRNITNEYRNNLSAYESEPTQCPIYQEMLKSLEEERKAEIEKAKMQYDQTLKLAKAHLDNSITSLDSFYDEKCKDLPREVLIRLHERYTILVNRHGAGTDAILPPPAIPEAVVKVNIQKYDNFKLIDSHLDVMEAEKYINKIK